MGNYINPFYWVDAHPLLYGNNGSLDPSTYDTIISQNFAGYCLCIFQDANQAPDLLVSRLGPCLVSYNLSRSTKARWLLQLISLWWNINIVQASLYYAWICLSTILPIGQTHEQRSVGDFSLKQNSLWSTRRFPHSGVAEPKSWGSQRRHRSSHQCLQLLKTLAWEACFT